MKNRLHRYRLPALVFVWFVLALLVFYRGHLFSNDSLTKLRSAQSLLDHGDFDIVARDGVFGITGSNGRDYPYFPLGSILAYLPPVAVWIIAGAAGISMPDFGVKACVALSTLLTTAITGLLLFIYLQNRGISTRKSFFFSSGVLFATLLLPYSSSGWTEPAALMWTLAAVTVLGRIRTRTTSQWMLFGVFGGIAALMRIELIVFFLLVLLFDIVQHRMAVWQAAGALIVLLLFFSLNLWFNNHRFGSPFYFGYFSSANPDAAGSDPGLAAQTAGSFFRRLHLRSYLPKLSAMAFTFGKNHFFWAAPLLMLTPIALWANKAGLKKTGSILPAAFVSLLVVTGLGYSTWSWSNRYIYIFVPLLLLPIAFVSLRERAVFRRAVYVLGAFGLVVSVSATFVNYHVVLESLVLQNGVDSVMRDSLWSIQNAPIWHHLIYFPERLIKTVQLATGIRQSGSWSQARIEYLDMWPVGLSTAGVPPPLSFLLWLGLVAVTVWLFFIVVNRLRSEPK